MNMIDNRLKTLAQSDMRHRYYMRDVAHKLGMHYIIVSRHLQTIGKLMS